jgi:hypothetical protein
VNLAICGLASHIMEPLFKSRSARSIGAAARKRDAVLSIVAALMIISGIVEVITGFRHTFLSIHGDHDAIATYLGAGIGVLCFFAGMLILTMKKPAAALAFCLLTAGIIGRIAALVFDLHPINTSSQVFAIVLPTAIACAFLVVLALKWKSFV